MCWDLEQEQRGERNKERRVEDGRVGTVEGDVYLEVCLHMTSPPHIPPSFFSPRWIDCSLNVLDSLEVLATKL